MKYPKENQEMHKLLGEELPPTETLVERTLSSSPVCVLCVSRHNLILDVCVMGVWANTHNTHSTLLTQSGH